MGKKLLDECIDIPEVWWHECFFKALEEEIKNLENAPDTAFHKQMRTLLTVCAKAGAQQVVAEAEVMDADGSHIATGHVRIDELRSTLLDRRWAHEVLIVAPEKEEVVSLNNLLKVKYRAKTIWEKIDKEEK